MYVRWKRTKRKGRIGYRKEWGDTLTAVLVKSERVNGQPRQKFVATLGSIREGLINDHWNFKLLFWNDVDRKLDTLGLDPDKVHEIRAKLSQRVPYIPQGMRGKLGEAIRQII